ncbi:MAG: tetratricopeptide repeat protein [Bacteroidaceae bacterium]|nr:tetratricopeptide repeat protein [Bacteroidaceae bacterium]
MRKLFLLILLAVVASAYCKSPKKVAAARNSVASILVYKNGELLRSGLGVWVNASGGELYSSYSLFVDGDSAVAIDNRGVVRPVTKVLGANETYDCMRLSVAVDKKLKALEFSSRPAGSGDALYMVSYGVKKSGAIEEAVVDKIDTISGSHLYYTVKLAASEKNASAPLVNAEGELVALLQTVAGDDTLHSYALSGYFVKSLTIKAKDYNSNRFARIGIRKALPEDENEALSVLLLQSFSTDSAAYIQILNAFKEQFPQSHQGYLYMAEYNAVKRNKYKAAFDEWSHALTLAEKDDEVYYHMANTIYANKLYSDSVASTIFPLDSALLYVNKALEIDNQPIYTRLKGNIFYTKRDFSSAFECYSSLTSTNLCDAELYVLAANCKEILGDSDAAILYQDSAIATFGRVPVAPMAPYILNRGLMKYRAGRFREAVLDYNVYANILSGRVNANFYYLREQAEYNGKMYRLALADIDVALRLEPENILFLLEKGRVCYRVNLIDDAIPVLEKAVKIAPDNPDAYYLLARCQMLKKNKSAAKENLSQAAKLGHPNAAATLKELEK